MIQQMTFLGLVVEDVAKSTEFYTQKLGLSMDEEESVPDFYTKFDLNGGGAVFALLGGIEQEGVSQSFDAGLIVDDIDATYAKFQAEGVESLSEPRDMPFGRTFLFRTPDGHVLRAFSVL